MKFHCQPSSAAEKSREGRKSVKRFTVKQQQCVFEILVQKTEEIFYVYGVVGLYRGFQGQVSQGTAMMCKMRFT